LSVRVLDAQGQILGPGWRVSADVPAPNELQGRDGDTVQGQADAAGTTFRLTGLPARGVALRASTENYARAEDLDVAVLAGASTAADLSYFGPDPQRRIAISARVPRGVHSTPTSEHVWLTQPGLPGQAQAQSSHVNAFTFDDLGPGVLRRADRRSAARALEPVRCAAHRCVRSCAAMQRWPCASCSRIRRSTLAAATDRASRVAGQFTAA
jgi:hypothetical protein